MEVERRELRARHERRSMNESIDAALDAEVCIALDVF